MRSPAFKKKIYTIDKSITDYKVEIIGHLGLIAKIQKKIKNAENKKRKILKERYAK